MSNGKANGHAKPKMETVTKFVTVARMRQWLTSMAAELQKKGHPDLAQNMRICFTMIGNLAAAALPTIPLPWLMTKITLLAPIKYQALFEKTNATAETANDCFVTEGRTIQECYLTAMTIIQKGGPDAAGAENVQPVTGGGGDGAQQTTVREGHGGSAEPEHEEQGAGAGISKAVADA